jgi:hypothetical protein
MNRAKLLFKNFRRPFLDKIFGNSNKQNPQGNQPAKDQAGKEQSAKEQNANDVKELNEDLNRLGNDWRVDVNQQQESHEVKCEQDQSCESKIKSK